MKRLALVLLTLQLGCVPEYPVSNPFDPEMPAEQQVKAALSGVVVGSDGAPLMGAEALLTGLSDPANNPALTGDDGAFNFPELTPGRYTLEVTHSGHLSHVRDVVLAAGDNRDVEITLMTLPQESPEAAHLTGTVKLEGQLSLPETFQDHSGILVEIEGQGLRSVTNVAGDFDVFLTAGTYSILLSAANHSPTRRDDVVVTAGVATTLPDSPVVLAANPGQISGFVRVTNANGEELADHSGVTMGVFGYPTTITSADGSFLLGGLAAGTHRLAATRAGWDDQVVAGVVVRGGLTTVLPDAIVLSVSRGRIAGRALLAGTAVSDHSGITVSLSGTAHATLTSPSGDYALDRVPLGTYQLIASKSGYFSQSLGGLVVGANSVTAADALTLVKKAGDFQLHSTEPGVNADYTKVALVELLLVAPADCTEIQVTGDLDVSESTDWRSYDPMGMDPACTSPVAGVVCVSLEASTDGVKSVEVSFRDSSTNVTGPLGADIILDTTPPEIASIIINGGATYANDRTAPAPVVVLSLAAEDAGSGIDAMQLAEAEAFTATTPAPRPLVVSEVYPLTTNPTDGEDVPIFARYRDLAGNWSSVVSDTIRFDRQDPVIHTVTIDCNGVTNAEHCDTPVVEVSIDAEDLGTGASGLTMMALSSNVGFPVVTWEPYAASRAFLLTPGNGVRNVYVKVQDAAGNATATPVSDTDAITIDTMAPAPGTISIALGESFTQNSLVGLAVTGEPVGLFLTGDITETGFHAAGAWPTSVHLSGADGPKTVTAVLQDAAGNSSLSFSTTILFDHTAPAQPSLKIQNGAERTAATNVFVNLDAMDAGGSGVASVRLADTQAGLNAASDVPFETVKSWTLLAGSGPHVEEWRTVWARIIDHAGNASADISDTILLDTLGPNGTLAVSPAVTADTRVDLSLTYDADAVDMKLSAGATCAGGSWINVTAATLWTLAELDGNQGVSVRFRDAMGNEGACTSDSTELDTTGPAPDSFSVSGNGVFPSYGNSTTVVLNAAANDADCVIAEIAEDVAFLNVTDTVVSCSLVNRNYLLSDTREGVRTLYVRFLDALGNVGLPAAASLTYDATGPIASTGGFTVAEGMLTAALTVHLTFAVTGADQMQVNEGADCGGSWSTYLPTANLTFATGTNEQKRINVRFRDFADNETACFTHTVTLDTEITDITARLEGSHYPSIATKTASQIVTLRLLDLTIDHAEMKVANDAGFPGASWQGLQAATTWVLLPGDGAKSVHVLVRDAAGNEATLVVPGITLDQSGPSAPGLQLMDIDTPADGFALSSTAVELVWSVPADADLEGFALERFVQGVDATFLSRASFADTVAMYRDDVTSATGRSVSYRLRAYDDLGNVSGWSMITTAQPFVPIGGVSWMRSLGDLKYHFPPNPGTFALRTTYRAFDVDRNTTVYGNLPDDVPFWQRPTPSSLLFDETLIVRTSNQDNTLTFDSEVPLTGLNAIATFGSLSLYGGMAITLDSFGVPRVAYGSNDGLSFASFEAGVWTTSVAGSNGIGISMVIDEAGATHILHCDTTNNDLLYTTDASGTWATTVADALGAGEAIGWQTSAGVDSLGFLHVSYYNSTLAELRYATNASGTWTSTLLDTDGTGILVGRGTSSLVVDGDDVVHVAYDIHDTTTPTHEIRYVNNQGGAWNAYEVIDTEAQHNGWTRSALAVDADGAAHVGYFGSVSSTDYLRYATNSSGAWVVASDLLGRTIDRPWALDLALDSDGHVHMAYHFSDSIRDLWYLTNASGAWVETMLDAIDAAGAAVQMAIDDFDRLHLAYRQDTLQVVKYMTVATPAWLPWRDMTFWHDAAGAGAESDAVVDDRGVVHSVFNNGTNGISYINSSRLPATPVVVDPSVAANLPARSGIAIDGDGRAHVCYYKQTGTGILVYATNTSGSWLSTTADPNVSAEGNVERQCSIAVDAAGFAHIAYDDILTDAVRYATNTTGSFVQTVLDVGADNAAPDLALDAGGHVHIVFAKSPNIEHATDASGDWVLSTITNYASGASYPSLVVRADGSLHVACAVGGFGTSNIGYSTNTSGEWVAEVVQNEGAAYRPKLALDSGGAVHIVSGGDADHIYLSTNMSGHWIGTTLIERTNASRTVSFAMDASDRHHLVYFDGVDLLYSFGRFAGYSNAVSVTQTTAF